MAKLNKHNGDVIFAHLHTERRVDDARGHERRRGGVEFLHGGRGAAWLIRLHGDVLPLDLGAVQRALRKQCVLLVPELDDADIRPKLCLRADGRQRPERAEQIVELRVRVVERKLLDEARLG